MQQIACYLAENGLLVITRVICFGILAGQSVMDLRYRSVSRPVLTMGGVLAAGYCLCFCRKELLLNLGGLLVGLLFVLVSKVTEEGLGYGDSLLLCILGLYLGLWDLLGLLAVAWLLAAAAAVVILASRRYRRGTVIPMVPFIAAGYAAVWISEMLR